MDGEYGCVVQHCSMDEAVSQERLPADGFFSPMYVFIYVGHNHIWTAALKNKHSIRPHLHRKKLSLSVGLWVAWLVYGSIELEPTEKYCSKNLFRLIIVKTI